MTTRDYVRAYIQVRMIDSITSGWTFSTYVLFILSTGHSLFHASMANVVFMATNFLLDPLTGKWGDKYGHRRIYLFGLVFWALGMFTYATSSAFIHFCIAEVLAGIGKAFISEALESWVENAIPSRAAVLAKGRGESRAKTMSIFSGIAGGLVGAAFGLNIPWLVEGVLTICAIYFAWRILRKFPESKHVQHIEHEELKVMGIVKGWEFSFAHKELRFILVFTLITAACFQPFNMFYSEWMRQLSGETWWIGFMWAGIAVCAAKGSQLTEKLTRLKKCHFVLLLVAIGLPILVGTAIKWLPIVLVTFFIHEVPRGGIRNLSYTFANPHIPSSHRSMLNSIRSAVGTFGSAVGLILFGMLSDNLSIPEVWAISSLILIVYAVIIWLSNEESS